MTISTFCAVLSSIFLILILPLSLADNMLSITEPVVVLYGISVITRVFLSFSVIFCSYPDFTSAHTFVIRREIGRYRQ